MSEGKRFRHLGGENRRLKGVVGGEAPELQALQRQLRAAKVTAPVRSAARVLDAGGGAGSMMLDLSQPGNPRDNGHQFVWIDCAKAFIAAPRRDY